MQSKTTDLPIIRSHERMDFKRCPKKWYWKWRRGLVPRAASFGALELGTWMHEALAAWYCNGKRRDGKLEDWFRQFATESIRNAESANAPERVLDSAYHLLELGAAMAKAYQHKYGDDPDLDIIGSEIPLEFTISDKDGMLLAVHHLKPDQVFRWNGAVWLLETKTAATIRTEYLTIDDQARPYGAMAEQALRKIGIIRKSEQFAGILYNFLRKALPDSRPQNTNGQYLNRDGSVSKRQPPAYFRRFPVRMTRRAKQITLARLQSETIGITDLATFLRTGTIRSEHLNKTQHWSCPKHCQFFKICEAEEQGADIRQMEQMLYIRRNPYDYDPATTDELGTFEMG